ncbi:hypothetical protein ABPG74_010056 [Tetrahymena malaccensis]
MNNFKTNLLLTEKICYANLVIGLVAILSGILLLGINSDYHNIGESQDIKKIAYVLLIKGGIFFAILTLLGIYAQRRRVNSAMDFYNIGVVFSMLFIVCSLIAMIYMKTKLSLYYDDKNCSKETLMKDLKSTYEAGKNLLCSPRCPCNANKLSFPPQVFERFYYSGNGVSRLDECDNYRNNLNIHFSYDYNNYNNYLQNMVELLRIAEESFDCSGFCSTNSYFVFRNMNEGAPSVGKDCKVEFLNFIFKNIDQVIAVTFLLAIHMLITAYLSLSILLSLEKQQNRGYYQQQNKIQIPNQNNYKLL